MNHSVAQADSGCPSVHAPAPKGVSDVRAALTATRQAQIAAAQSSAATSGGRAVVSFDPLLKVSSLDALQLADGTLPSRIFVGIPTTKDGFYTVQLAQADVAKNGFTRALQDSLSLTIQDLQSTASKGLDPAMDALRASAASDLAAAVGSASGVPVYAADYEGASSSTDQPATVQYIPSGCPFVDPIVPASAVESWGVMQDNAKKLPAGNRDRAQLLTPADPTTGKSSVVAQ